MKKAVLAALILVIAGGLAWGDEFTWDGDDATGDWDNPNNWYNETTTTDNDGFPDDATDIIAGFDAPPPAALVNIPAVSFASVTVDVGAGTVTLGADLSANALTITSGTLAAAGNTVTVNGDITFGAGLMTSSGTVSVAGAFARTGAGYLTSSGTGTVIFNGTAGDQAFNPAGSTFVNVTVNKTVGAVRTVTPSAPLSLSGNLTMTAGTLAAAGNAVDIGGNLAVAAGIVTSSGTVSVAGNWTRTGAGYLTSSGTGTVVFDGSADQSFVPTGSTFVNLTVDNDGGAGANRVTPSAGFTVPGNLTAAEGIFAAGGNTIVVGGNFMLNTGGVTSSGIVRVAGDFARTAPGAFTSTGTLQFNGAGAQAFNPAGSTFAAISAANSGTVTASGSFSCSTYSQSVDGGTFQLAGGYTMTVTTSASVADGTLDLVGAYSGSGASFSVGSAAGGTVAVGTSAFVAGAMTVSGTGVFRQTGDNGGNANTVASLSVSGGECSWDYGVNGGTLTISGACGQTAGTLAFNRKNVTWGSPPTGSFEFYDLIIPTGVILTPAAGATITVRRSVYIYGTGVYNPANNPALIWGGPNSVAGGVYYTENAAVNMGTMTVSGPFTKTLDTDMTVGSVTCSTILDTDGNDLTAGGALTVSGTLDFSGGGTVFAAGNLSFGTTGTAQNSAGSTVNLNGGGAQTITPNGNTFGIVLKTGAGAAALTGTAAFASLSVSGGSFTVGGAAATALTINGTLENSSTLNLTSTAAVAAGLNASAGFTNSGTFTIGATNAGGSAALTMADGTTIDNTGGIFRVSSSTGAVTLASPGTTTLVGNELDLNSRTLRLDGFSTAVPHTLGASETFDLDGDATFSGGLTLNGAGCQVVMDGETLTVTGLTVTNGLVYMGGTGTIAAGVSPVVTGASGTIVSNNAGILTAGSVTNAGNVTFQGTDGASWTVNGDFESTGGIVNTRVNTITVYGDVRISSVFQTPANSRIRMGGASTYINAGPQIGSLTLLTGATGVYVSGNDLDLYGDLTVETGANLTDETENRGIAVGGNVAITSTGSVTSGSAACGVTGTTSGSGYWYGNAGALTFTGSFTLQNLRASSSTTAGTTFRGATVAFTSFTHNGGTVQMGRAGDQAFTTAGENLNNLSLVYYGGTAKTVTVTGALTVLGALEVGQSQTLNLAANNASINVTGATNATAGTTYGTISLGSSSTFTGAFRINALTAYAAGASAINFNGATVAVGAGGLVCNTSTAAFGYAGTTELTSSANATNYAWYAISVGGGTAVRPTNGTYVNQNFSLAAGGAWNDNGQTLYFASAAAGQITDGNGTPDNLGAVSVTGTNKSAGSNLSIRTLSVSGIFSTAARNVTVDENLTVGGTLDFGGGGTVTVSGNLDFGTTGNTANWAGSALVLNGTGTQTITPNGRTFGAVSFTGSSGTPAVTMVGTATFGSLAIASTETFTLGGASATNLTVSGALNNAGTLTFGSTDANIAALSLGANSTNSGAFTMRSTNAGGSTALTQAGGTAFNNTGTFTLASSTGNLTLQGSAASATFSGNDVLWGGLDITMGNLVYDTGAAPSLASGTTITLNNPLRFADGVALVAGSEIDANTRTLTLSAASSNAGTLRAGTGTITAGANSLTNTGAVTFTGAGTLACGTLTNNPVGTITLAGGTVNSGAVTNDGTIAFGTVDGAAWSAAGFNNTGTVNNDYVNTITASGNVVLGGSFNTTANSTLVMTGGGTTLSSSVNLGSFTADSGGTVSLASDCEFDGDVTIQAGYFAAADHDITANADWINATGAGDRFVPGAGTVEFTDPTEANISGSNQWYNLRYNQPGGRLRMERNHVQRFLTGGVFQAIGTPADRVTITRDDLGDDDYDLDWIPPAQPLLTDVWSIYLDGTATIDFQNVTVWYSDARDTPVTFNSTLIYIGIATLDLFAGERADTCYMWISSLNAIYSYTEDSDDDGRIDRLRVEVQAQLDMDFSGFSVAVEGYDVDTGKGFNGFEGTPWDMQFYIHLVEKPYLDGAGTPAWRITSNTSLHGAAPDYFPLVTLTTPMYPADTVPPRIAYTLTVPSTPDTFFAFNEPVRSSGGGDVTAGDLGATGVNVVGPIGDGDAYGVVGTYGAARTRAGILAETPLTVDPGIADDADATAAANGFIDYSTNPAYSWFISNAPTCTLPNALTSNTHRVSDLLISVEPSVEAAAWSNAHPDSFFVWPVWAKDEVYFPESGEDYASYEELTAEEAASRTIGFIRGFDGTRWLRDQDFTLQAEDGLGLGSAPPLLYKSDVPETYRSAVPGIWLPDYLDTDFSGLAAAPFAGFAIKNGAPGGASLWDYSFSDTDAEVYDGAVFDFYFRVPGYPADLYCGRLDMETDAPALPADWYRRVRPFSFEIHNVVTQRGGVSILNNVIDPTTGETVRLHYTIDKSGPVTVTVFTLDGDVVRSLHRGTQGTGEYTVSWNGRNRAGDAVARGMYFIRIVAPGIDEIRKVMVVRY